MRFPRTETVHTACTAALGIIKANQINSFSRLQFTLAGVTAGHPPGARLYKALASQVNILFQIGMFQHDFSKPLPEADDKWITDTLIPWLEKYQDAIETDYEEHRANPPTDLNGGLEDLLKMLSKAMRG